MLIEKIRGKKIFYLISGLFYCISGLQEWYRDSGSPSQNPRNYEDKLTPELLVLNCHLTPCSSVDQVACSVPTSAAAAAAGNKNFSFSGAPSSSGNAQFSIGEGWVVAVCSDD